MKDTSIEDMPKKERKELAHRLLNCGGNPPPMKKAKKITEMVLGIDPAQVGGDVGCTVYGYRKADGAMVITRMVRGSTRASKRGK